MDIGLMGPMVFDVDGVSCIPTAAKPRALLATLLLNANTPVSPAFLIDELWPDDPPPSARTTLQTYVLHLRKLLPQRPRPDGRPGRSRNGLLRTAPSGYQMTVPVEAIDTTRFDRWVTEGRRALDRCDDARGIDLTRRALALWRGTPFADVPKGPVIRGAMLRLEEKRMGALDRCINAELRLGHHHELLDELSELVSTHQHDENLHWQYMLALARSGRRLRALEIFRALRHRLVGHMGIEPSSRLQQLHSAILASDPAVDYSTVVVPHEADRPHTVPRQRAAPVYAAGRA